MTHRPAHPEQFFIDHRCPNCGGPVDPYEDGGHDMAIECRSCQAKYGVQMPPFVMIEQISPPTVRLSPHRIPRPPNAIERFDPTELNWHPSFPALILGAAVCAIALYGGWMIARFIPLPF